MNIAPAVLTQAERARDQIVRDEALRRLAACDRIVTRMVGELRTSKRHQALWVPTAPFLEALYWAELQLCRARHVQERAL